jgi:hypothetical protein
LQGRKQHTAEFGAVTHKEWLEDVPGNQRLEKTEEGREIVYRKHDWGLG